MVGDDVRESAGTTSTHLEHVKEDPKKRWIERMIKSAKKYHKICPYTIRKQLIVL